MDNTVRIQKKIHFLTISHENPQISFTLWHNLVSLIRLHHSLATPPNKMHPCASKTHQTTPKEKKSSSGMNSKEERNEKDGRKDGSSLFYPCFSNITKKKKQTSLLASNKFLRILHHFVSLPDSPLSPVHWENPLERSIPLFLPQNCSTNTKILNKTIGILSVLQENNTISSPSTLQPHKQPHTCQFFEFQKFRRKDVSDTIFHPNLVPNFSTDRGVENDTCQVQLQKFEFLWQVSDSNTSLLVHYHPDVHHNVHLDRRIRKNEQWTTPSNFPANPLCPCFPPTSPENIQNTFFCHVLNTWSTAQVKITALVDPPKNTLLADCTHSIATDAHHFDRFRTSSSNALAPKKSHFSSMCFDRKKH